MIILRLLTHFSVSCEHSNNICGDIPCLCHFLYEMHTNKMFDLENEGQGRGVHHPHGAGTFDDEYQSLSKSHLSVPR